MTDSAGGKTAVHVPDALTENKAFTFSTTHNAVVDFFFEVVPRCSPDTLQGLLKAAYEADAQLTLRAIFHLGNVKDGKADRANFYESLDWLRVHHPRKAGDTNTARKKGDVRRQNGLSTTAFSSLLVCVLVCVAQ